MKVYKLLAAAACTIFFGLRLGADTPKGHLVIIGGGGTTNSIRQKIVECAGGEKGTLLVVGTAGGDKAMESAEKASNTYIKAGMGHAVPIDPTREDCDDPKYVNSVMKGVTGAFFCGGSQRKIVNTMRGTLLHKRLQELYMNGGVISGSSAGAAMMSDPMITGKDFFSNKKGKFVSIAPGQVEMIEGMGFLAKGTVIDQHFLKRKRQNRLFSVVLEHPDLIGIGIDEATAIVVSNERDIEVIGKSAVMVVEASKDGIKTNSNGDYAGKLSIRLFVEGDTFTLPAVQ